MTDTESTILIEEFFNDSELDDYMEEYSAKMVEERSRRITDNKELQHPGNSISARQIYAKGSATREAPNTTATTTRRPRGGNLRNDENSQNQVEVDRETKTLRGYGGGGEPSGSPPSSPDPSTGSTL